MASRSRKVAAVLVLAALGLAILAGVALASQENIGGNLNRDGSLVKYWTLRTHTYTGVIRLNLNNNTANYTRLGLRNTSGTQFTNTEQWNALGWKDFHLSSNGSSNISAGTPFYFNGRMGSTYFWQDNQWGGTLTY